MAKVIYLGPLASISCGIGQFSQDYIFLKGMETEVTNEKDLAHFKDSGGWEVKEAKKEKIKATVKDTVKKTIKKKRGK